MNITIINGPNLNLLGVREPGIYGNEGFASYLTRLRNQYPEIAIEYFQSNHEGAIIDKLHEEGFGKSDGIVLNAGAYTHTSLAIADAIAGNNHPRCRGTYKQYTCERGDTPSLDDKPGVRWCYRGIRA